MTLAAHADDPITVGTHAYGRDDGMAVLGRRLNVLPDAVHESRRVELGAIAGCSSASCCIRSERRRCIWKATPRATGRSPGMPARAVLNALDRLAGGYDAQTATARQDLAIAQGQLRDYEARLGRPFAHEAYLADLTGLRDQLKTALSANAPEPGATPLPSAGELAGRIISLKAAHTIEPAPARVGGRAAGRAELPVTARIRRQTNIPSTPSKRNGFRDSTDARGRAALTPAQVAVSPADPDPLSDSESLRPLPFATPHASSRPGSSHGERITRDKRAKARQLSLF